MKEYLSEDSIPGKLYDTTIIKKLMPYIMRYRLSALLSILMVFLATVLFLLGPYIFGYAIDHGIVKGNKGMVIKMALLLLGTQTLRALLVIAQSYNIQNIGQKVEEGTHDTLMHAQGLYRQLYQLYVKKEMV